MTGTNGSMQVTTNYQWTTGIIGIVIAAVIILLIRRDHMHTRYAMWWLPAAVAVAVLGAFPGLADFVASRTGVNYPPILAVVVGLLLILVKLVLLDIELSRTERKLHRLTQRLAILEGRMDREKQKERTGARSDPEI